LTEGECIEKPRAWRSGYVSPCHALALLMIKKRAKRFSPDIAQQKSPARKPGFLHPYANRITRGSSFLPSPIS
jgi:hypothetical protein